jgi:hypothetical protein
VRLAKDVQRCFNVKCRRNDTDIEDQFMRLGSSFRQAVCDLEDEAEQADHDQKANQEYDADGSTDEFEHGFLPLRGWTFLRQTIRAAFRSSGEQN